MALVELKNLVLERLVERRIVLDMGHGAIIVWGFMNRHGIG